MTPMMKEFYISILNGEAEFKEREFTDVDFCKYDVAGNYILKRYLWVSTAKSKEEYAEHCKHKNKRHMDEYFGRDK